MGAAAGDFNNDGCVDLYVTNLERSQLFRNKCDGTFTDVSRESGAEDRGWSVSAAFVDYDRDGWLDLFVGNYVYYSVEGDKPCLHSIGSLRDYCPPSVYRPQPDRLYHNNRNGTFTDVTVAAGMGREFGPALGVSTADFNGDGWTDIYVANVVRRTSCGSTGTTALSRIRRSARALRSALTVKPKGAWASTPAISTTTATKTCSSPSSPVRGTIST
jgi:hypothetical protein